MNNEYAPEESKTLSSEINSFVENADIKDNDLVREGAESRVLKSEIKSTHMEQIDTDITGPAYIIDLSAVRATTSALAGLMMFTSPDQIKEGSGDEGVDLYLLASGGKRHIGRANADIMYRMLIPYVNSAFNGNAIMYYLAPGKTKWRKVKKIGMESIKLDL